MCIPANAEAADAAAGADATRTVAIESVRRLEELSSPGGDGGAAGVGALLVAGPVLIAVSDVGQVDLPFPSRVCLVAAALVPPTNTVDCTRHRDNTHTHTHTPTVHTHRTDLPTCGQHVLPMHTSRLAYKYIPTGTGGVAMTAVFPG